MPGAKITALGCYVPPRLLTNQDLEKMVDTSDYWITEPDRHSHPAHRRSGNGDIGHGHRGGQRWFCETRDRGHELDAIIVCTVTPDMLFPSTACIVQNNLGAKGAWGFDLIAACSGFVYGLTTAAQTGSQRHAEESTGDRRRHHVAHHRLPGPLYLRAVRGWRRRHAGGAYRGWRGGFIAFKNEIDGSGGPPLADAGGRKPHAAFARNRR